MAKAANDIPPGLVHLITVGTTFSGAVADVVQALIDDLGAFAPRKVVVLATQDSVANGERLIKGLGLKPQQARIRRIPSAQSLDDAYLATAEEIARLRAEDIPPQDIILHYTAGTKVMSAGAVLAAVNNDVKSLRYIFSTGPRQSSTPVNTPVGAVVADSKIQLAIMLMRELRFRAAGNILAALPLEGLTPNQAELVSLLRDLTFSYSDWDNFRVKDFLKGYRSCEERLKSFPALQAFRLSPRHLEALNRVRKAATAEASFPDELLIDLVNNAIRRLVERRPDDALIRLHRAAELYAQGLLKSQFDIRTDDVEIRKVPPRNRTSFEAERRLDDAKVKLGLRKSYDLLDILGHPVGAAYRGSQPFRAILDERRNLVLAHGTRPATTKLALEFLREVETLLLITIPDLHRRAALQQFPWIDNEAIRARLSRMPVEEVPESAAVPSAPAQSAPKQGAKKSRRRR